MNKLDIDYYERNIRNHSFDDDWEDDREEE